jgi:signal transduction histidine kinase
LQPLAALRRGIADIRAGRAHHLAPAAPVEVAPLVEEVNALLDAQDKEIFRSRSRAADLAHGFKTPLAALITDAARLRQHGEDKLAEDIEAVADTMSRHVDRELALVRLRGGRSGALSAVTELAPLLDSLVATLLRTPAGEHLLFERVADKGVRLPFDRTDLAEVLGNLLENAAHHARAKVRVTARTHPLTIVIEDDGDGIPEPQIARVLERGGRLDEQGSGAGLGLSIVRDVLDAYGWHLQIARSELGGARVAIAPDTAAELSSARSVATA